ncbi:MAG: hypothetical protein PHG65_08370, partial [Kiritimatiellae bacterium]|nr:hypothetical protein [Kiritimatiellia bacterium]
LIAVKPVYGQEETDRRGTPGPLLLTRLELSGVGYMDKVADAQPIRDFRDRLRESDWFADTTEIRRQPSPQPGGYLREFELDAVLEKPLGQ